MNIDWFTFAAQIVNFLVLVALLRWLLYDPIVRAMSRREEKIAGRLEEAERKREEAERKIEEYERKSREIEQQREGLLQEARREAEQEKQRHLQESRQEVDRRRERWQEAFRREQDDFLADLRREAGHMAVEAARRTLSQLADADLEGRMCDAFAARLQVLGGEQREEIRRHLGNGEAQLAVRSAFDVSEERREGLREAIRKTFEIEADISFQQSSDLICGLELDVGGYSFGWSVKDFLSDLDLKFSERLRAGD